MWPKKQTKIVINSWFTQHFISNLKTEGFARVKCLDLRFKECKDMKYCTSSKYSTLYLAGRSVGNKYLSSNCSEKYKRKNRDININNEKCSHI